MNSYELIQAKIETGIEAAKKEIEVKYSSSSGAHQLPTVSLSDGDLLIGPCRSQRLGQRQEARTGQGGPGTRGIIKEEPGPKECAVNTRVPNPFSRKGR
jgi:hypothetical protein